MKTKYTISQSHDFAVHSPLLYTLSKSAFKQPQSMRDKKNELTSSNQ